MQNQYCLRILLSGKEPVLGLIPTIAFCRSTGFKTLLTSLIIGDFRGRHKGGNTPRKPLKTGGTKAPLYFGSN